MAKSSDRMLTQMNGLINELLESDGPALGTVAKRRNVNVSALLRASLQAWSPAAHAKRIVLITRPPSTTLHATLDEGRIMQTLCNLLSNAIKFTARGGQVRLEARAEGADVRFAVADTGGTFYFSVPRVVPEVA